MNVGRASKSAGIAIVVLSLASATAGGAAMDAAKARQRQHGAVFVSGYVDGVHGFNLMDPENPVTVAWYDTFLGSLNEDFTPVFNGTFGIDVRNADGLIVASDSTSGFWAFRMEGFQGWSGEQWGYPNISSASHDVGPEAPEALAAVRRVDAMVGRLVEGLEDRGLLASTNIVVTSDHGMTLMDPERDILFGDFVELLPGEVFEAGAFLQIYPDPGREGLILDALRGAHPRLAVYGRDEIPERFHLVGHPRLAPIVGIPDVGWSASSRETRDEPWARFLPGNHGGDPQHPDMHGVFIAAGPSFAVGVRVPAFENIELYNLMARAFDVEAVPNQGDLSRVEGVLR